MKSVIKALVAVMALVLVFGAVGCQRATIKSGDLPEGTTTEDLNIQGTITFTVNNESGTEAESMAPRAVVKAFMSAYPNAKVIYEESNRSSYPTRISSGDIGDVFWCDENDTNNYQRNHNALMALDYYIKPMNIDVGDVYSGALDEGKINGRLYMVPRKIGMHVLIYNKDMLQEAGIDYDGTEALAWEDFKQVCKQLTKVDESGRITQAGAAMKIWWSPIWQMFFRGFGGKWIDNVAHKVTIVDDTEVMKGLEELITAVQEGWLAPEDIIGSISGAVGQQFAILGDGDSNVTKVGFKTFGAMTWLTRLGNAYDNAKVDWDFCPFPAFPVHNISTGATGYVVYNRTNNPDTAAAFALFFLTEAGQRAYHSQTGGNVPLLKSLADEDFWKGKGTNWEDKNYAAMVSYTDCTQTAVVVTQAPTEIAEIFSDSTMMGVFANILSGRQDMQTAFNNLQTKANEKWATLMTNG